MEDLQRNKATKKNYKYRKVKKGDFMALRTNTKQARKNIINYILEDMD